MIDGLRALLRGGQEVYVAGTVICGIDASGESRRAAHAAIWLAQALDLEPVLIHAVTDPPAFPYGDTTLRERAHKRSIEAADALLGEVNLDGLAAVERHIARGEPADALASVAAEMHAKLVAVGSRGRGPMRAALLGSTSMAAIRRCGCPVLVFPRGAVGASPGGRSLVCGIDGSRESEHALRAAVNLRDRLDLELVLVHVQVPASPAALRSRGIHPPLDYAEQLDRMRQAATRLVGRMKEAAGAPPATRERIEPGPIADRIDQAAEEEEAALIVVGARGLGALGAAALGSVSTRLAGKASRPVLVVKRDATVSFDHR